MKVRVTTAGTPLGARLTALCLGALTLLAPLAVSACTSGSSSTPSIPTISASVTGTASGSARAVSPETGSTTSGTPDGATSTPAPAVVTATATATVTVTPTSTTSRIPSAAPVTGGGGTAGLQDGLLFGLGVAAILVGAGSIAYRRWLTRGH